MSTKLGVDLQDKVKTRTFTTEWSTSGKVLLTIDARHQL